MSFIQILGLAYVVLIVLLAFTLFFLKDVSIGHFSSFCLIVLIGTLIWGLS